MTISSKITAELRDWTKHEWAPDREAFQGRVFNDIDHKFPDGTFHTIKADNVEWNKDGALVWEGMRIYVLWFAYQRGT